MLNQLVIVRRMNFQSKVCEHLLVKQLFFFVYVNKLPPMFSVELWLLPIYSSYFVLIGNNNNQWLFTLSECDSYFHLSFFPKVFDFFWSRWSMSSQTHSHWLFLDIFCNCLSWITWIERSKDLWLVSSKTYVNSNRINAVELGIE